MSGNVKLILQSKEGEIFISFPNKSDLQELIIHKDLNSNDEIIRNNRFKEIKNQCLKYHDYLKKENDQLSLSLLSDCIYKTPDWYGICFVSFKEMIIVNIQDGSSIKEVFKSKYIDNPISVEEALDNFITFKNEEYSLYSLKYNPEWLVIENNLTKKHILKVKALMEFCEIKFNPIEEKRWFKFIKEIS